MASICHAIVFVFAISMRRRSKSEKGQELIGSIEGYFSDESSFDSSDDS